MQVEQFTPLPSCLDHVQKLLDVLAPALDDGPRRQPGKAREAVGNSPTVQKLRQGI